MAKRDKIPVSVASEKTNSREQVAKKRYRQYYGITKLAPDGAFDLIIDSSSKSIEKIATMIASKFNLSVCSDILATSLSEKE